MRKIKIGLPRALTYYEDEVLLNTFLRYLKCQVIISQETDDEILKNGLSNTISEYCLPYKIYIGHILKLMEKCDYIIINIICGNRICLQMYDYLKEIIPKEQIIEHKIKYNNLIYEFFSYLKLGIKLKKNIIRIIISYFKAKKKQKNHNKSKAAEVKNQLTQNKPKILIIAHSYIINDKITKRVLEKLINNKEIQIIDINNITKESLKYSSFFSKRINNYEEQKLNGALYYLMHQIDAIIFLTMSNCLQDEILYNLAMKKNSNIPSLKIEIKEQNDISDINNKIDHLINIINGGNHEH